MDVRGVLEVFEETQGVSEALQGNSGLLWGLRGIQGPSMNFRKSQETSGGLQEV